MVVIELANPKRTLIKSKQEYLTWIKKNSGIKNMYQSLYKYKYQANEYKPDYESAIIDKMFFDMDSKNALEVIKKFHKFLIEKNIRHYMVQSSYLKFHMYILCKIIDLNNKRNTLLNAMTSLAKQIGLSYGRDKDKDLDSATFGDICRICPIPNTYKPKRKSYCNYITENDLEDLGRLKQKSLKPGSRITYYGEKLFNLKKYDSDVIYYDANYNFAEKVEINLEGVSNIFPPFIKKILTDYNGYGNWENRWRFTIFCRDIGLNKEATDKIAREYFSKVNRTDNLKNNYQHYKKTNVLNLVYNSKRYKFPNINKILSQGYNLEKSDIDFFENLYF